MRLLFPFLTIFSLSRWTDRETSDGRQRSRRWRRVRSTSCICLEDGRRSCPYVLALTGHRKDGLQEIPSFASIHHHPLFFHFPIPFSSSISWPKLKRNQAWNSASSMSLRVGRSPPKTSNNLERTDYSLFHPSGKQSKQLTLHGDLSSSRSH